MTYDQYWGSNDSELLREYREADKLRQERMNNEAWLFGAYVKSAIESSIGNAFRKKGAKATEYPKRPIELIGRKKTEAEKQQEIEAERMRAYLNFDAIIRANKARNGK